MFPRLLLRKAGALLAPQDPVADVLSTDDEVQAEIQGWDLPPLPERYRRVCASLGLAPFPALLKLMELQSQSSILEIPAGIRIPPDQIPPFLRALKQQEDVQELRMSNSQISEGAVAELGLTLGTLPRLARLQLRTAGMGPRGIRCLCTPAHALQSLQELDLSLNPLGDAGGRELGQLLRLCPALVTLHLRGCGLTRPFPIPEESPLRTLSLSYNALGREGLGQLLRMIPTRSIRSLELASVIGHPGDIGDMGTELARFLLQPGCALCHLSLAGNHLRDTDIEEVARCLPLCPSLLSLDLSANPGLGSGTFRKILEGLENRERGLDFLSLAGCDVRDPDGSQGKIGDLRLPGRRLWNTA